MCPMFGMGMKGGTQESAYSHILDGRGMSASHYWGRQTISAPDVLAREQTPRLQHMWISKHPARIVRSF